MRGESLTESLNIKEVADVISRVNSDELDDNPMVAELRRGFIADEIASRQDHIHYPKEIHQRIAIRGMSKARSLSE